MSPHATDCLNHTCCTEFACVCREAIGRLSARVDPGEVFSNVWVSIQRTMCDHCQAAATPCQRFCFLHPNSTPDTKTHRIQACAYVARAAYNEACKMLRKPPHSRALPTDAIDPGASAMDPDLIAHDLLGVALPKLSKRAQEVYRMRILLGYDWEWIAEALGVSVRTALRDLEAAEELLWQYFSDEGSKGDMR